MSGSTRMGSVNTKLAAYAGRVCEELGAETTPIKLEVWLRPMDGVRAEFVQACSDADRYGGAVCYYWCVILFRSMICRFITKLSRWVGVGRPFAWNGDV